jgi:sensor histidine kinase YesM
MLLQPLVENCIKHGLSGKIEGGSIVLRSRMTSSRVVIEVEDDGVGMESPLEAQRGQSSNGSGIGVANVEERLKVLYDGAARMSIESEPGKGTRVRLRLPILPQEGRPADGRS